MLNHGCNIAILPGTEIGIIWEELAPGSSRSFAFGYCENCFRTYNRRTNPIRCFIQTPFRCGGSVVYDLRTKEAKAGGYREDKV